LWDYYIWKRGGEPTYEKLFAGTSKTVLDLEFVRDYLLRIRTAMIAYKVLSKLFEYSDLEYKAGGSGSLLDSYRRGA
jgi:hypothetical protein